MCMGEGEGEREERENTIVSCDRGTMNESERGGGGRETEKGGMLM